MSGAIFDLTGSYRAAFLNGIAWNLLNMSIAFWLLLGRPPPPPPPPPARRSFRIPARPSSFLSWRDGPRGWLDRPRPAGARRSPGAPSTAICCCRSWSSSLPPATTSRVRDRSGGCRDRRALRRADLIACARHDQGQALYGRWQVRGGARAAGRGHGRRHRRGAVAPRDRDDVLRRDPACQEVYAFGRAREWTAALAQWCAHNPRWSPSRPCAGCIAPRSCSCTAPGRTPSRRQQRARERAQGDQPAVCERPAAFYQQAEVHRLRGEFAAAEEAYRRPSQWGWNHSQAWPCCGWRKDALDAAVAAIRRALSCDYADPATHKLLPAGTSRSCSPQATSTKRAPRAASSRRSRRARPAVLSAMAAHAQGAVDLADGDARAALGAAPRVRGGSRSRRRTRPRRCAC